MLITPETLAKLTDPELKKLHAETGIAWLIARDHYRANCLTDLPSEVDDQCRLAQSLDGQVVMIEEEVKRREIP